MGKSFKGFSKALSLILAVAMVVTCVPTSAYAAELLAGESEDILISNDSLVEESSDALVTDDASASEEKSSTSIDTQKEADLVSAPEENTAGEEEFGPDTATNDVDYGIVAASATNFGVFTVAGDQATSVGSYTTLSGEALNANVKKLDSVNGVTVYVAPKNGFEITDAKLATAITVVGSYKENDAATDSISLEEDTDYTITKSTKTEVDGAVGYDFSEAYAVTIKGNTTWLKAYKEAQENDTLGLTTDSTIVKALRITVTDADVTAKPVEVKVVGGTQSIAKKTLAYTATATDTSKFVEIGSAMKVPADWAKKDLKVSLIKEGADPIEYVAATGLMDTNLTDGTKNAFFFQSNNKLYVNGKGIQTAVAKKAEGYALTATISDKDTSKTIYVTTADTLVTYKALAYATAGDEKDDNKYTTEIKATESATATKDTVYLFKAKVEDTIAATGRNITSITYTVDGTDKTAKRFDLTNGTYDTGNGLADSSNGVDYAGATSQTYVAANALWTDGVYFAIPASDVKEGKSITLKAVTSEKVSITLPGAVTTHYTLVDYYDGDDVDNKIAKISDNTDVSGGFTSKVETNKNYKFSVKADSGYNIKSVEAVMYNVNGTGGQDVELEEGDFGVYSTKNAVTGKLEIVVKVEESTAGDKSVKKTGAATVQDLATGTEVNTSGTQKLAHNGTPFEFRVKPSANKVVTKVEYLMGAMTEMEELTPSTEAGKTATIDGVTYYKTPNVNGNIEIKVTEAAAMVVSKTTNPDAKITIGTQELKDEKIALAEAGKDFTIKVEALNGATIDGVYYAAENTSAPTTTPGATYKLSGNASGEYTLSGGGVTATTGPNNSKKVYITVVTSRADTGYTVAFDSNRPATTGTTDNKDIKLLTMKAGYSATLAGAGGDDNTSKLTYVTISPTITTSKNAKINAIGTGTAKWSWDDTTKAKAIATLTDTTKVEATTFNVAIFTTKVAESNTLKFEYKVGFPNALSYNAELPVTSEALSTVFSKLEVKGATTLNPANSGLTRDGKTVRVDDATNSIDDSALFGVMTYTKVKGEDTPKGATAAYDLGGTSGEGIGAACFVKSIAWKVSPEVETTVIDKPYESGTAAVGGGTGNGQKVETFKKDQDLTVEATVTFQDDSKTKVSDVLHVVKETFGYVAVPTVTINGDARLNTTAATIETKSGGTNSLTIGWRVFKQKVATASLSSSWNTTDENITKEIGLGNIEEVSASDITLGEPKVTNNTDSTYATVGTGNPLTVTAKKKTTTAVTVGLNATVKGMPVNDSVVSVTVNNELAQYVVTVNTNNTAEQIADYQYPQMTSGLVDIKPISMVVTDEDRGYDSFTLTNVTENTVLTLPAKTAFNAETINPKTSLYGWSVTMGGDTKYYKADGNAKVSITGTATIAALWAYNYAEATAGSSDSGVENGYVNLFEKVGTSYVSLATQTDNKLNGKGAVTIANGKEVGLYVGYQILDVTSGPDNSGLPQYGEMFYTDDGLTLTSKDNTGAVTVPETGGKIAGAGIGTETLTVKYADASSNKYEKYQTVSGKLSGKTDGLKVTELTVTTASEKTYTVEISNITDLEVGQTKTLPIKVMDTSAGTPGTRVDTKDTFADIQFKAADETVAKVELVNSKADGTKTLHFFKITGVGEGSTTINFTATDAAGNVAALASPVSVSVVSGKVVIEASVINATTATTGEKVAAGTEMGLLMIGNNNVVLSAIKNGSPLTTVDGDWAITASNPASTTGASATDVAALTAGAVSYSGGKSAAIVPAGFGVGTLTVTYQADKTVDKEVSYSREIPVRSFYAVGISGPVDSTEAGKYEVYNGTTKIETGKKAFIKVPYADGSKATVTTKKYAADTTGFTANLEAEYAKTKTLDFKGWTAGAAIIETGVTTVKKNDKIEAIAGTWATNCASDGIYDLAAVFGAENIELSNLPDVIELDDSNLSKKDKSVDGSDRLHVEIGVTPYKSGNKVSVKGTDNGKLVFVKDEDAYPGTGPGFATTDGLFNGVSVDLAINTTGSVTGTSRTDTFTIAKVNDEAKTYVGTTKLIIVANNETYKEIPVYLNGEFKDTTVSPQVYRYMYRGEIFESGEKTVNGEVHYYKDSAKVINDTVEITEGGSKKLILIKDGKKVTAVGYVETGDKAYYVGKDGFLKTGKFVGEGKTDTAYTFYASETGELIKSEFVTEGGKLFFFDENGHLKTGTGDKFTSLTSKADGNWKGTFDYVVGTDGAILTANTIKVGEVTWYVNSYGQKVTYEDAKDDRGTSEAGKKYGKYTDPVSKVKWVIYEDGNAAMDDVLYAPTVTWTTEWPKEYVKGNPYPTMKYKVNYTSKNQGKTIESEEFTATVTCTPEPIPTDAEKATFTATADLSAYWTTVDMKEKATATKENKGINEKKYTFKNGGSTSSSGGIELVGFEEGQEFKFTGSAIKPAVEVWDNDLGVKLTLGVDYSLSYKNNTKITTDASKTPIVTVNGKGNYVGKTVTRTFKIVDPREGATDLTATVKKIELGFGSASPVYNGEPWYPETITVDGNAFQHSSGEDYTTDSTANYVFSFSNNTDAGTATVGVTGQDGKTKKKTFKIAKVDLSKVPAEQLEISPADTEWAVKGAVPATTVTYTPEGGTAITLVEGQDYKLTVNYADRKKNVADGNKVTITGKGTNFAKKATSTETFKIEAYALSNANILEVVAPAGAKVKAVKATVVDGNGVKINKKDYTVNVYDSEDTVLAPTATLTAGSTYKVEVVAPTSGNITGSGSFEFIAAADMSKAKVTLSKDLKKNGVAYTGESIDITAVQSGELIKNLFDSDITVEYKNPTTKKYEKLTYDEDFKVLGYQNNVKKGNMTVYIRANDDSTKVSGVKYFKIKIAAKTMKKAD